MSQRKRRSNQKELDQGVKIVSGLVGRYPRQALVLVISVVVLAAIIAAVYFLLYLPANTPAPVPAEDPNNDEAAAAQVGRNDISPDAVAPVTPAALGSGATVSSDWYQLRFTNPLIPTDKSKYSGGLDADLVALMNKATTSIDVADYDFDLLNVAQAMAAARSRKVTVRMVTDSDTLKNKDAKIQAAFGVLKTAGITVVEDNRGPIMHDKFTVVDKEWLETGSWNYTEGDTYRLNNNAIIIHNRELAANYANEFEKMFTAKQFGPNKPTGMPNPQVTIGASKIQTYFAAQDKPAEHIIATLKTAQRSIYFMAFSFTHDGIAEAMKERSQAGVTLGGVFEKTGSNTPYSEFTKFKALNLPRSEFYTDGNPYVMHHKVIIVDERITMFGSFNFSDNANNANDENLLIVDDANIAKAFKQEYDRVLELAKNPPVKKK